ncbi:MAG: grasp-with-spasm system SPASM domain peptide maturase [Chitinophagaceae bacterium]|jgi:SPASM domain peptide maturase of grasp-with-spasm system
MRSKLFSCCVLTKGTQRSLICDLQRNKFHFIPNSLYELLDSPEIDFQILIDQQEDEINKMILKEYESFLLDNELLFTDDNLDLFPPLSLKWESPFTIQNAIIEIGKDCVYLKDLLNQLECLGLQQLELRFHESDIDLLRDSVSIFRNTNVNGLILFFNNSCNILKEDLEFLLKRESRIERIFLYNNQRWEQNFSCAETEGSVIYLDKTEISALHCGIISSEYFVVNIPVFTESQQHNTCLNRKISIDAEGNIKNCPSMAKSYGNIKGTKLIDVVNNSDFQKVWHIKKDEITKCKDCEFRHICTDCRAYVENPEDQFSAPLKCGYNPYTCEWEEWSTNPLKQKAIQYYGMRDLGTK